MRLGAGDPVNLTPLVLEAQNDLSVRVGGRVRVLVLPPEVEVADLLYNVPARKKFLKGEATETSHIADVPGRLR